jgi:hypothetical protein
MSGHEADYEGYYGCPLNLSLYYFSKEEAGQDDYLRVPIPKGVRSRGEVINIAS